ncbi:hypothetical protein C7M84_005577 [Penaeus vannamei]|uniref:Uncharacterized protein n=1 Tax=Penaeus vannamei TaxID=6689 RepID=A0A3R7M9R0_PENVA|nr:hypothetical protein C7M84_005577 [Penaeus vannamei]
MQNRLLLPTLPPSDVQTRTSESCDESRATKKQKRKIALLPFHSVLSALTSPSCSTSRNRGTRLPYPVRGSSSTAPPLPNRSITGPCARLSPPLTLTCDSLQLSLTGCSPPRFQLLRASSSSPAICWHLLPTPSTFSSFSPFSSTLLWTSSTSSTSPAHFHHLTCHSPTTHARTASLLLPVILSSPSLLRFHPFVSSGPPTPLHLSTPRPSTVTVCLTPPPISSLSNLLTASPSSTSSPPPPTIPPPPPHGQGPPPSSSLLHSDARLRHPSKFSFSDAACLRVGPLAVSNSSVRPLSGCAFHALLLPPPPSSSSPPPPRGTTSPSTQLSSTHSPCTPVVPRQPLPPLPSLLAPPPLAPPPPRLLLLQLPPSEDSLLHSEGPSRPVWNPVGTQGLFTSEQTCRANHNCPPTRVLFLNLSLCTHNTKTRA